MFTLAAEPLPNRTAEEMRKYYEKVQNTRQLVNLYAAVLNAATILYPDSRDKK